MKFGGKSGSEILNIMQGSIPFVYLNSNRFYCPAHYVTIHTRQAIGYGDTLKYFAKYTVLVSVCLFEGATSAHFKKTSLNPI